MLFSIFAAAVSKAVSAGAAVGGGLAERELVKQLLDGDEAAFKDLVERFQGKLLRLAMNFVPSRAVAEEVVQETWLGVLQGLPKFEGRSSLKTWIFRILTNRAKTRGTREGRTVPFSALAGADDDDAPAVDPQRFTSRGAWAAPPGRWHEALAEDRLLDQENMTLLKQAIDALPAQQRTVITLRDVEGLEAQEVCNLLEISETNQRVLLHRARSKVRTSLEQHLERS